MKVKISAVIITFNEERNIHRCLESLEGLVDEIVVEDSYSRDRTEEICKAFGARFLRHRFYGHIEQKNWAILQATYPCILSLDADEALSDELRASILRAKENWTHDGYYFNRLTNYCGKWIRHTSWYPSRKLRLWDSRMGSWGGFNPHDRFYLKKGSSRQFLRGDILHYSYYSVSEHLVQMNTFSSILARSYYERGRKVNFLSIILHPIWRFLKDFLIRRGFMDGYYGLIVSVNSAHEVFLKYVKLRNIYQDEKRTGKNTICFFNSMHTWGGGEKWHFDVATYMVRQQFSALLISSPGSPLSEKLKEVGVRSYGIRVSNLSFLNPVKLLRIARIFRREKVGILITNLSGDMKVASIAGKIAGVPSIIYRRGSAIPVRNTPINRYLFRRVITKIVANSWETRRTILANNEMLVPDSKIRVIYNGVHISRYHENVIPLYRPVPGEIVLGSAGRLSEEKGHDHLLEMLRNLQVDGHNFTLLIAGEGRLLGHLQRKARRLGIEERVKFLGFVEDMPSFFMSLDIFLLPSTYEGFGYVIAEAMASRKPVIAFDIRSSAEIIVHGKTGFVTERNSPSERARRVLELAENRSLREEMGRNGRKRVEALFSFEKNREEIMDLILRSGRNWSPATRGPAVQGVP
ncbi:MAG: glycosyltransferase [Bacteroidetes bacterium]|nr:MAG: glycosyltransferase [Bacteroidota bacterium]